MSTGRYITLEGAEGCGKSTHAARLADALDAVLTRETGGTAIGQRIRTILHDTTVTNLSHRAEALLTAADRAQHIDEIVAPALISGRHVVSDRSVYSTLAYQGYGRELPLAEVRRTWCCCSMPLQRCSSGACADGNSIASSRKATTSIAACATASGRWPSTSRRVGSPSMARNHSTQWLGPFAVR